MWFTLVLQRQNFNDPQTLPARLQLPFVSVCHGLFFFGKWPNFTSKWLLCLAPLTAIISWCDHTKIMRRCREAPVVLLSNQRASSEVPLKQTHDYRSAKIWLLPLIQQADLTINGNATCVKLWNNTPEHPEVPLVFKIKCAIALLRSDKASYLLCCYHVRVVFFLHNQKLATSSPKANHPSVPLPGSPPQLVMETDACRHSWYTYSYLKNKPWTDIVWDGCQTFAGVSARVTTPSNRTLVSMRDTMMTQWYSHTT